MSYPSLKSTEHTSFRTVGATVLHGTGAARLTGVDDRLQRYSKRKVSVSLDEGLRPKVLAIFREAERALPYRHALESCGADATFEMARPGLSLHGYSGLVLLGGTDVDAALYGEQAHPENDAPDPARDVCECIALAIAIERDLPVLAICRGMQLLNVWHGGSLIQHLPPERRHRTRGEAHVHDVDVAPGTVLARAAGAGRIPVNSRHHQAVRDVGTGLRVTARAPEDGTIEAVERPASRWVVGVQWHPEDLVDVFPPQKALFTAFADACAGAGR